MFQRGCRRRFLGMETREYYELRGWMASTIPKPWAKLYGTRRWERRSEFNLRQHPLCAECERQGRTQEATLSHHLNEYREGMTELDFYFGPIESLCYDCHSKIHGRPARLPYRKGVSLDGMPIDPMHPFWVEERRQQEQERKWHSTKKKAAP
jgi:5-methylcytosine-specific restriction enzyme A